MNRALLFQEKIASLRVVMKAAKAGPAWRH